MQDKNLLKIINNSPDTNFSKYSNERDEFFTIFLLFTDWEWNRTGTASHVGMSDDKTSDPIRLASSFLKFAYKVQVVAREISPTVVISCENVVHQIRRGWTPINQSHDSIRYR